MFKSFILAGAVASLGLATGAFAQANLTAETAAPGSTPGVSVLALAEVASKAGVADIQVATGQTLTNSVQNVAEGKTDIAAAPFILPFLLSRGVGPYAKIGKETGAELAAQVAVLYTYRISVQGLYAYDSAAVAGWEDLKGRTIFNGPPRGAALTNARNLVKLVAGLAEGDDYTGVQVNWGQAVKTIRDGSAEAFVLPMSFPDGRVTAAVSSGDMTIWSLPKALYESETFTKYTGIPGTVPVALPISQMGYTGGVTVASEDDLYRGPGTVGGEIVNVAMDFELAKALTAAFLEGLGTYHGKAPFMPNAWHGETDVAFTDLCGASGLKYHPGAVAAWEEAGYTIPDCAK
ncbi:TRAP transporter solute receptor, TAXI family precursor [Candidatus Rhodobacter oscarellae]|uniref:TRAP transporter solute receptor, TAXI family n=1 Tax=Candidatus Rhodobacter oscarellae TaxID=1675527 RepID=A0A0J9E6W9_9RHOB|nr:TAXI family TRAP transporter solute-binding subunit [Candidatus Rhodobacter lobularis]KMW58515.1 TRAP transporter solute receptor, TAXI family precursor [Candidatus Rhodobacter lobularis]